MTGMRDDESPRMKDDTTPVATTVAAEDESTCAVFGMPKEATRLRGTDKVVPPTR